MIGRQECQVIRTAFAEQDSAIYMRAILRSCAAFQAKHLPSAIKIAKVEIVIQVPSCFHGRLHGGSIKEQVVDRSSISNSKKFIVPEIFQVDPLNRDIADQES